MKKLFLSGAVVLAMTLVSCGGSKSENQTEAGDDSVAFEEVDVIDVAGVDTAGAAVGEAVSTAAVTTAEQGKALIEQLKNSTGAEATALAGQAKDYIVKLVSEGKIQEAKDYFAQVGPSIKEKAPKVYDSIKAALDTDKIGTATEAVKEKASEVTESAKEKATELKDKAADKIKGIL